MTKPLLLGGVLGGLALFIGGMISWMALPWHAMTFEKFKDEAAVAQAISANAGNSGIYFLPNPHKQDPGLTEAQRKAAEEDGIKRMMEGPFMFASVSPRGARPMGTMMGIGLATQILAALMATWLLLQTTGLTFWKRVGFLVTLGLTAGVITNLQHWNWWNFSTAYTAVCFGDLLIGWFLAGLVIAKVASSPSGT